MTQLPYRTACPKIINKEEWGGRPPKVPTDDLDVPVPFVVLHHGGVKQYCVTENDCAAIVRSYQNLHMDENGWNDIGYNFVVGEDGNVYRGRGWETVGAHSPTYNFKSIGICIIGDFTGSTPVYTVLVLAFTFSFSFVFFPFSPLIPLLF
jgi:N-acetylmuramoyl-L-alanine amidase